MRLSGPATLLFIAWASFAYANGLRTCNRLYLDLLSLAALYAKGEPVPGNPMGRAFQASGRYLRTTDIDSAKLPYSCALRPSYQTTFKFPGDLSSFPKAKVKHESDVLLVSNLWSGSVGLVRLAELDDGTPVALKTYPADADFVYEEAKSAQLLSELGIGPRFHGVFRDSQGRVNVVMDLIPGDFATPETVSAKTFADLETVISRLREAKLEVPIDMQAYVTPEGRYIVIDPSTLASRIDEHDPRAEQYEYQQRIKLIESARPEVAIAYLENLRRENAETWRKLITYARAIKQGGHFASLNDRVNEYIGKVR